MFKHVLLFVLFIHISLCTRSFTIVLDTTVSMREEILVLKANIGQVVSAVNRSDFGNFVLVPFKDTVIETPYITQSAHEFTSHLGSLIPSGGYDCPENSLAGIEAALRNSEKQSSIFVFTDAFAKDYNNFRAVETLCKETHSQVTIFLSGFCFPSKSGQVQNVEVYYDVAKACSGAVFRFDTTIDLRQAFRYMREIVNTDWTTVTSHQKFTQYKQFPFSVDSFTTDFVIVISGDGLDIEVLGSNAQIVGLEYIVMTRRSLVVRVPRRLVGEYTASVRGQGSTAVTFFERNSVPFQFGFSTKSPRSIKETASRPRGGWPNYLLINVDSSIKLRTIEWLNMDDSVKQILFLNQISSGSYVSSTIFVEEGKMFRFWVIGEESSNQHEIRVPTKLLSPQPPVNESQITFSKRNPEVEILDSDLGLIDYGAELRLACKVAACPKSYISWKDQSSEERFPSEVVFLEIPSVYIAYLTITNVTKNLTMSCECDYILENKVSKYIDVFVNRTFSFDVIKRPEDASVEYGSEHHLYCQVDAYPEATIKWYINETLISIFNSKFSLEDNALVIKNMDLEDVGAYECRATNEVESKNLAASIEISGVEAPEIEETETELKFKAGDKAELECRIAKGKPDPEIVWKYKAHDSDYFTYLGVGVTDFEKRKNVLSLVEIHEGIYKCTASNAIGESSRDFNVKFQSKPIIRNSERETVVVKEDEDVHLSCDVEATPRATVRWEMSQDDVIVSFDHRHHTDDKNTHHFRALWNDSGNYHCIAENIVGKAERTVTVNVLVSPYIETPKSKSVNAIMGSDVVLACNILDGNPAPTTRWEFIAKDSTPRTLIRENTTSALLLRKVSRSDEGSYLCIAENQIGTDRIKYYLAVQELL